MERVETSLPGVYELRPVVHRDSRGAFLETYHYAKFSDLGIKETFLQDNHSISSRGTLRGFHYQLLHAQAKLCRIRSAACQTTWYEFAKSILEETRRAPQNLVARLSN